MSITIISKDRQGYGAFNGGQIVENKPIGFPRDGGEGKPYSNLFYWAYAEARVDSTIGLHPHQGFEIMSFILKGSIRHFDTKLNEWRSLNAGDAQIIRAGNGISHKEHMNEGSAMFQIWVDPDLNKTLQQAASYDDYQSDAFPVTTYDGYKIKMYSGADAPLKMDAPGIEIMEIMFDGNFKHELNPEKIYSIYVREGALTINGERAVEDDFIKIENSDGMQVELENAGVVFMIASPKAISYKTYLEMMEERTRR